MCFVFTTRAYADIASGTSGTCSWVIDDAGVLTIRPTNGTSGMLASYDAAWGADVPWASKKSQITKVVVKRGVSTNSGCVGMFYGMSACTEMDLSNLNTTTATNMAQMFSSCNKLTELDLSGFNTSNVLTMEQMFYVSSNLTSVDISSFITNKVTNMKEMFSSCFRLTSINMSPFITSNVTNMKSMFNSCYCLQELDLTGWDARNVTDMSSMFLACRELTSLNLTGFRTRDVTNMSHMFNDCERISDLDLGGFSTSNVTDMSNMFRYCENLTAIDLSGFVTSNVTNMGSMFAVCRSLTSLDISGFDTSNATNTYYMFNNCSLLRQINLGDKFDFKSSFLNTPPSTDPYTGKWIKLDRTAGPMTAQELQQQFATNAGEWSGIWVWEGFVPPTFRLAFSIPSDVSGAMVSQDVDPSQAYTLERQHLYKFGYRFKDWRVDGTATTIYLDGATIPANTYSSGITVTLIPEFEAVDTSVTMSNNEIDLYLCGNEKATFDDLPAGTAYQIWEETPDGWVLISQSGVSGNIEPLQTSTASFVNQYVPGATSAKICGSKIQDGKAVSAGAYQFQLLENGSVIQTVANQAGGFIEFDPITYNSAGTHVYTVREIDGGDSSIIYDNHVETITVTVAPDDEGALHTTVNYDADGINFVNTTKPGVLEIVKQAVGLTQANRDSTFTFNVVLQNNDDALPENGQYNWRVE